MVHGQQTDSVPIGHKYNLFRTFHYLKLTIRVDIYNAIEEGNDKNKISDRRGKPVPYTSLFTTSRESR